MQSKAPAVSWVRRVGLQALVMLLLAPILVLAAPQAEAQSTHTRPVPAGFGIPVEQSAGFEFGTRASSASFAAAALLQVCDETQRGLWTRGGQDATTNFNISLGLLSPGMRYEIELCTTYTYTLESTYIPGDCFADPLDPLYGPPICLPGTTIYTSVRSGETVTASAVQTNVPAPDALAWIEAASKEALEQASGLEDVYWNSSPHHERRQIVGLNTFFAASAAPREPGDTEGWFPDPLLRGSGGPIDVETNEPEIQIAILVEPPRATFKFSDDIVIDCAGPGTLWEPGILEAGDNPADAGLCVRSWRESSVAAGSGNDFETVELEEVNLFYPWQLHEDTNATEVIEYFSFLTTSGEFTSKRAGGQEDFVIGEVQTYGVDPDGNLTPDSTLVDSGWVESRDRLCEQVSNFLEDVPVVGWFAGKACEAIVGLVNIYATAFELIWDGAVFVVTVVKVIASAAWDLIKGCIAAGSDALADLGETAGAVVDFVQDPGGQVNEVIQTVALIEEQLANPDTRWEFVQEVLMDLLGEFLDLDLIAEQVGSPPVWELKDDPQWAEWVGKVACGVLIAAVTAGVAKALKATKVGIRIQRWLDGGLPDAVPCALTVLSRGAEYLANVNDFVDIVNNNSLVENETNSFPRGTLVLMADGSYEPIEDVEPGAFVLSFDFDDTMWEPQVVTDQWSAIDDGQIATVTLADGSSVQATDGHLFWVENSEAWVELEDVVAGDQLLTPVGAVSVQSVVEAPPAATEVFELTVAENHNFVVSTGTADVLVHNRCRNNGGNSAGDGDTDFRQNEETGTVTYESEYGDIDGVALDADRQPTVIKTGDFELILMEDGTLTVIDGNGNIIPGGVLNPDGSVSVTRPDGSQFIVDKDGDSIDLPPSNNPPFTCNSFLAGTEVLMGNGSYAAIEDIEPGDQVLSFDFALDSWVAASVAAQWSAADNGVIATVTLEDGSQVSATDHHRFWVESSDSWVELDQVQPGNLLLTPTDSPVVAEVSLSGVQQNTVWELSVERTHNFTVRAGDHDVLVHNCDIEVITENGVTTLRQTIQGDRHTAGDGGIQVVIELSEDGTITTTRGNDAIISVADPNGVETITSSSSGTTTTIFPGPPPTHSTSNTTIDGAEFGDPTSLPIRDQNSSSAPTHAVGINPVTGEPFTLRSGAVGPAYDGDLTAVTATNNNSNTHVEGHAAAIMAEQNIPVMEITINNHNGVCDFCNSQLPELLDGGTLIVQSPALPDGTGSQYQYIDADGVHDGLPPGYTPGDYALPGG